MDKQSCVLTVVSVLKLYVLLLDMLFSNIRVASGIFINGIELSPAGGRI